MTESAPWNAFEDVVNELVGPVTDKTVEVVMTETAKIELLIADINSSLRTVESMASDQRKSIKSVDGKLAELDDIQDAIGGAAQEEARRATEMQLTVNQLSKHVAHLAQQVGANTAETHARIASVAERIEAMEFAERDRSDINLISTNQFRVAIESQLEKQRRLLYGVLFLIGFVLIAALVVASSLA